jgi:CHASE3 domain sensor protein
MAKSTSSLRKPDLQSKLFLIFTLLFVIVVLVLGMFLQTIVSVIGYNTEARDTFEHTRKIYQIQSLLQKMELAQNNHENTGDAISEITFYASSATFDDTIRQLQAEATDPQEQASLARLQQQKESHSNIFHDIVEAVFDEDWDTVDELDGQAYDILVEMYDEIDAIVLQGEELLDSLREKVNSFRNLAWLMIFLTLPIFVAIVCVSAIVVHFQINDPLIRLSQAVKEVETGKFKPESLGRLLERQDEIGAMAREFAQMEAAIQDRRAKMRQEADEIRAKIK